mgnify:FL=1
MACRMKDGYNKYLTEEDLWSLPVSSVPFRCPGAMLTARAQPDDTAEALGSRLEKNWVKRRVAVESHNKTLGSDDKKKRPSLTGALVASYGTPFFTAAIFKVCPPDPLS